MAVMPSRIDLLTLDIDLRLVDLWRDLHDQAFDRGMSESDIEFVATFMHAAYGKGYCDALTEDMLGQLCVDHGYQVPSKRPYRPSTHQYYG